MGDRVFDAVFGIDGDFPERIGRTLIRLGDNTNFRAESLGYAQNVVWCFIKSGREIFRRFRVDGRLFVVAIGCGTREEGGPLGFKRFDFDAVLRTLRSSDAGLDGGDIEFDNLAEFQCIHFRRDAPQALGLVVIFHCLAEFFRAAGATQVAGGDFINAEKAHRRTVFGSHVRDRGTVGQAERLGTRAVELDKLAHHLGLAQQLSHAQHKVGCCHTGDQFTSEINTHDFRHEECHWLAEHARFSFDATHAPTNHAKAVDHCRMRIGADEGIGIIYAIFFEHAFRQILQVHLVNNADAWRHDFEGIEGLFAPFEKLVAFTVTMKFQIKVARERITRARIVHLHAVVHHEIDWHQGLDHFGILAHTIHRRTHRRKIHQQRHPREVLQHDARYDEWNFIITWIFRLIGSEIGDVLVGHFEAVVIAQ